MNEIMPIGLNLAKTVFHVVCCDVRGKLVRQRMLKRSQVPEFFAHPEPCRTWFLSPTCEPGW